MRNGGGGVGSNQGAAYIYDRSDLTIPGAQGPADKYYAAMKAEAEIAKLTKPKQDPEWAEAMSGLQDQEFWYRHQSEIQANLDKTFEMGAELRAAGIADPLKGTDEASILFQKQYNKTKQESNASIQLKTRYEDFREELAKQSGSFQYTPGTIAAGNGYFNLSLEEHTAGNVPEPTLLIKDAEFVQLEYDQKAISNLPDETKAEMRINPDAVLDFAKMTLDDPRVKQYNASRIAAMTPQERDAFSLAADAGGMSVEEYIRVNDLSTLNAGSNEFDFVAYEKSVLPQSSKSTVEKGDVTIGSTRVSSKDRKNAAIVAASDRRYVLDGYASGRFGEQDPNATFQEKKKAAQDYYENTVVDTYSKKEFSRTEDEDSDRFGFGSKEYKAGVTDWLQQLRSGDITQIENAGGYIQGLKLNENEYVKSLMPAVGGEEYIPLGQDGEFAIPATSKPGDLILRTRRRTFVPNPDDPFSPKQEVFVEEDRLWSPGESGDEVFLNYYDRAFKSLHGGKQNFGVGRTLDTNPGATAAPVTGAGLSKPKNTSVNLTNTFGPK